MFAERYAKSYDLLNREKPYKKEVEFVYRWARKPKSIFDIGAGTGSYWKHYPKGTEIIGMDRSMAMADQNDLVVCGDITKMKKGFCRAEFDCATALFDVLNYIPRHDWWKNIPVKKGGYFIFDVWDAEKVMRQGFEERIKAADGVVRHILPSGWNGKSVDLRIDLYEPATPRHREVHRMYVHTDADIKRFCGKEFELVATKTTRTWQKFYKCKRK
jgi:hypothetical protein